MTPAARQRVAVLLASLVVTSCAARAFVRPAGRAAPAPEAAAAWAEATARCRSARTFSGALGLTGRVGDQRIRGLAAATLGAAVTADGAIGLEARVSGQLLFRLGGSEAHAVLLLAEDNRTVAARADDIMEALIGIRLGPEQLLALLTGCVSTKSGVDPAARYGEMLQVTTTDATVFLVRRAGGWQARAGDLGDFSVDYQTVTDGLPRVLTLRSREGRRPAVSLTMSVRSVDINRAIVPAAFAVVVPGDARPMTLEDLRASGPLGGSGAAR